MKPTDQTADFLRSIFEPTDRIALLLRFNPERNRKTEPVSLERRAIQRIVRAEQVWQPRFLAWLMARNAEGRNVQFQPNPLKPTAHQRMKSDVGEIRWLYLDVDTDADARMQAMWDDSRIPLPTWIITTSPGKYQLMWRVTGYTQETQEDTLKLFSRGYGGDIAATDSTRLLRLPGLFNRKYEDAPLVTAQELCDHTLTGGWMPTDFDLAWVEAAMPEIAERIRQERKAGTTARGSSSEDDWKQVMRALKAGADPLVLTAELKARRTDKPDPTYYSERTVDRASARIWISMGWSDETIIEHLTARRSVGRTWQWSHSRAVQITKEIRAMHGKSSQQRRTA